MPPSDSNAPIRRTAGRRAGSPDTRAAILNTARKQFAEQGYEGTSLAGIAREVGVDATLITHFFGGKQALFAATLEAVRPAFAQVGDALAKGRRDLGWRLAQAYFNAWESPELQPDLLSMLRSASTSAFARDVVVATINDIPLQTAHESLTSDVVARLPLAMSVLVGVGFTRYVLQAPSVREASVNDLIERLAPAIEEILD